MSPRSVRSASARSSLKLAVSGASCTLLLLTAVGCGSQGAEDDAGSATDTSTSGTSQSDSPSPSTGDGDTTDSSSGQGGSLVVGETVEAGQAVVVSASNVDGETTERASALVNDEALDAFVATTDARLADGVRRAAEQVQVPAGHTLFGAVVAVGCETPTTIEWTRTFDGIEVQASLPKPGVQCLVPVTSVALFVVPSDLG